MRRGFSLVELSIVLVILGLLTGGILMGQSLIRSSQLRAVSTEAHKFSGALEQFRDKYNGIAGDIDNAVSIWGDNATACSDGNGANNGDPGTCNGNNNGYFEWGAAAANATSEVLQTWNQLALGGFIEGSFLGTYDSSGGWTSGKSYPMSRLPDALWANNTAINYAGDASAYALDYGNFIEIGASANGIPPLSPDEAYNIDRKIDDGIPSGGMVIARYWNNGCATPTGVAAATNLNSSYRTTVTTRQCQLIFRKIIE